MKRICLVIAVSFSFIASYAQCDQLLKDAHEFKKNGDYERAAIYYEKLNTQCPNYMDQNVKKEWEACKSKQNKTSQKKPSSNYVAKQPRSTDWLNNMDLYFDETGNCLNEICRTEVTYQGDWFVLVPEASKNWLHVVQYGNSLDVSCDPNLTLIDRIDTIDFVANASQGTQTSMIIVHQEAKGTSPKRTSRTNHIAQTNYAEQPDENLSITVKVTFETKKAKPTFDNTGNIIELLELLNNNNNLGLQIETPWCSNQKSIKIIPKYPMTLIDNRIKNIKDHFTTLGIAKERISTSIKPIDVEEGNKECDCGYVRIIDIGDGSSK